MSIIKNMRIEGLWGDKQKIVEFNFFKDVNFIIGVNGSGKTTVINLLAAILQGDFQTLDKLSFNKITIKLQDLQKKTKPIIEVSKQKNKRVPFDDIIYKIQSSSADKPTIYNLNEYAESVSYRDGTDQHRYLVGRRARFHHSGIVESLNNLVRASWLSVHRITRYETRDSKPNEPAVDVKLKEVVSELAKYFSTLDKRSVEEQNLFQENMFLALLVDDERLSFFDHVQSIGNIDQAKAELQEIFSQFKLNPARTTAKIEKHFKRVLESKHQFSNSKTLDGKSISTLILNNRIDAIIEEWNKFRKSKTEIFLPQNKFLEVLNNLFQRKMVSVDEKNELKITTQSGKDLSISELSSGEKQLLIVLGQALIQRNEQWIYIADEPELSLHVTWQDALVNNLRILNPNAQIIFATHSPDIVSQYADHVFDMEKLI